MLEQQFRPRRRRLGDNSVNQANPAPTTEKINKIFAFHFDYKSCWYNLIINLPLYHFFLLHSLRPKPEPCARTSALSSSQVVRKKVRHADSRRRKSLFGRHHRGGKLEM